jgi:release factor glutamine methyltransferase
VNDSPVYAELLERLSSHLEILPDKPEENPENTLKALWLFAQGNPHSAVAAICAATGALSPDSEAMLRNAVETRISGVPLSHIVGRQHFMGMEMLAGPEALVPRVETELLAGTAIALAQEAVRTGGAATLVDICTGSGNIALALASRVPNTRVFAADLSAEAVSLARRNAEFTGLSDRVQFAVGDLLQPFADAAWVGDVDVLTCNPPYISSGKVGDMPAEISSHEPAMAFDGGPFGVSILFRLLQDAPRFLKTGGWLVFEVGLGQGPAMAKRLTNSNIFDQVRQHADGAGNIRALSARKK